MALSQEQRITALVDLIAKSGRRPLAHGLNQWHHYLRFLQIISTAQLARRGSTLFISTP